MSEDPGPEVTRELFLAWRAPRRGAANPERMDNPVWAWLVRSRMSAYQANDHFQGPSSVDVGPGWCCDRFGQSSTRLPDGCEILIGGEHEDHYDADFHIYNDVIVLHESGAIDIYGYPVDVFPPTDFHYATLVGRQIVLIGSLGYPGQRDLGRTQVLLLDLDTWTVSAQATSGSSPGWIHGHSAELAEDARSVTIRGGETVRPDARESLRESWDEWRLDLTTWTWKRLTERPWQCWELRREDGEPNHLWEMRQAVWEPETGFADELDADEPDLPHRGPPEDPELLRHLYEPEVPHRVLPKREDEYNVFRFEVGGVTVRCVEDMWAVTVTFEGELPDELIDRLVVGVRDRLTRLVDAPWAATRR